jgi:hypothetical protein
VVPYKKSFNFYIIPKKNFEKKNVFHTPPPSLTDPQMIAAKAEKKQSVKQKAIKSSY